MDRFPWRFAVYLVAGLYLFADMMVWKGPIYRRLTQPWEAAGEVGGAGAQAVVVYGRPITRLELAEALRAHLWQRGETWSGLGAESRRRVRWLVLEQMVNDRIVRAFRVMNGLDNPVDEAVAAREVEMQRRQFPTEGEWQERLGWQARTEKEYAAEVREALEDEAWIEEKIRNSLGEITDEVVAAWYEAHREEMRVPERFRASHLFLTAHDPMKPERLVEVAAVQERLTDGGESFEKVVAEVSEDERTVNRGGDLGWFTRERMPEDFMVAVEAMKTGEINGPVRTKLGWHWIRLEERAEGRVPEWAEVKEEIRAHLLSARREQAVRVLLGELRARSVKPTRFLHYFPAVIDATEPAAVESEKPEANATGAEAERGPVLKGG